jgi:hypothetical protein
MWREVHRENELISLCDKRKWAPRLYDFGDLSVSGEFSFLSHFLNNFRSKHQIANTLSLPSNLYYVHLFLANLTMVLPVMKKATTAVVGLTANAAGAEALAGAATGRASDAGNWRRELRDKQLQQSANGGNPGRSD